LEYKLASASNWTQVGVVSPPHTLNGLTPNSSYQVRVRTNCNGSQSSNSNTVTFTTTNIESCGTPSGLVVNNTTQTSAVVSWNPVPGAISYTVQYKSTRSGFWMSADVSAPPYTITGLSPFQSYEVRVRANCNGSQSAFSDIVTF